MIKLGLTLSFPINLVRLCLNAMKLDYELLKSPRLREKHEQKPIWH